MPDNSTSILHQVSFSWYDYVLFSLMLSLSALIGIYFGCFGSKQSTTNEYLMGNKKMRVVPIAISLVASHISGITLLGVPADVYRYGATYGLFAISLVIVALATIFVYLPVFFKLQITSTYEYLERRFDRNNRMFSSLLFALGLFLYLPIVIYIPALGFSVATGINVHYITPVVCGVCIFYTTIGGLKAVVWTDTLQFTVTTGAVFTVFAIGVRAGGGFAEIWKKALEGHRLDVFNSLLYFSIGITVMISVSVLTGLIMYARYADCDPFTIGAVEKNDQLLPYYIMDVASHVPGLSGLFIAGIFCAALSTLSASLNCLAGTVFEDFILKLTGPIKDERKASLILKMIVVVAGIFCTALVYIVEHLGGLLPLCLSFGAVTNGPLLGLFTLGLLFPKAASKGSLIGAIVGLVGSGYIAVMAQYYKSYGLIPDLPKPTSIDGCLNITNLTVKPMGFANLTDEQETFKPFVLFRISYYYYTIIGTSLTMVFGLFLSYVLKSDDPPVHKDLISPLVYFVLPDEGNEKEEYFSLEKALEKVSTEAKAD